MWFFTLLKQDLHSLFHKHYIGLFPAKFYTKICISASSKQDWITIKWCMCKMADIFQTTFSNAFSRERIGVFLFKIHRSLFLRVKLKKKVCNGSINGLLLGRQQAISYTTTDLVQWYICITRPEWVNYILRGKYFVKQAPDTWGLLD